MKRFSSFISLLALMLKRLRFHPGLSVSSVIGISSILSLVICIPVFTNAVLTQVLMEQLTEKSILNHRSLFSLHISYPDNKEFLPLSSHIIRRVSEHIRSRMEGAMGLEIKEIIEQMDSRQVSWEPVKVKSTRPAYKQFFIRFTSSEKLFEKLKLVEGRWPQAAEAAAEPLPVAVLEDFADENFLNVGDVYRSENSSIQVVGIFRASDPQDKTWFNTPEETFRNGMWVPVEFFEQRLTVMLDRPVFHTSWYAIVEDRSLRYSQSLSYTRQMIRLENELRTMLPEASIDDSPLDMLVAYDDRLNALIALFYAAGAPVLVLALLFTGLVAAIAVRQSEGESAVITARGGSAWQVIALNLLESMALILLALPPALAMGWLAAGLMGQTELFLKFTRRPGFTFSLGDVNLGWLFLAVVAVILARLAPLVSNARPSLLSLKQERSRSARKHLWERSYLDLLLLIPGLYAYLGMRARTRAVFLAAGTGEGMQTGDVAGPASGAGSGSYDPLMFLASSIFAIALCMLALRLFPLALHLLAAAATRLPQAWSYLAVHEIARRPRDHASAILLIMISLSFAIFSASMAKTLDRWMSDFQYYRSGADLVVREYELSGGGGSQISAPSPDSQSTNSIQMVESMISLEHHLKLPSIQSATYSGKWDGHFSYGAEPQECTVMGIDRLTFPTTGFYRRDFAAQSLGVLMNALAAQPFGVLIPEGLALESGLQPGDRLHIETSIGVGEELFSADMIVVGLYRYFPTVVSFEKPTLIASLESLFGSPDVVTGVDVWLNLRPGAQIGSTDSFNQFADLPEDSVLGGLRRLAAHDWLQVEVRGNALNEVEKGLRQPEWVGLFGVLNVGFLLTGLLPAIGFVLYSFAALHKRLIQFGILQALGLSTRQAAASLLLEQVLLMSVALTGGAGVGFLTSSLFLPFLQVGQAGAAPVPPFVISVGWGEAAWLCAAFGLLFLLTLAGMMASLASTKIFQAVKMGESV